MRYHRPALYLASATLVSTSPSVARAQEVDELLALLNPETQEIVVRALRLRGQLDVEQPPLLELEVEDIEALGVTSVAELVEAIAQQTDSSRGRGGGRPVYLVNGIRIGSFRELRSYPPEAIAKVEVFAEEVAQKFGFSPDRRVVNLVLKENFRSREVEFEYELPAEGGFTRTEQEATYLRIDKGGRLNVNLERSDRSILLESERGIILPENARPTLASDPDPAAFRSLLAESESYEATVNWAKAIIDSGSSLSFNATYERDERRSLFGLDSVVLEDDAGNSERRFFNAADPLERMVTVDTFSTAGSWTGPVGNFRLTGTVDAGYADTLTLIDNRVDTAALEQAALAGTQAIDGAIADIGGRTQDRAEQDVYNASSKATLTGGLANLPGGELSTTFDLGYDWDRIESEDSRTNGETRLTRGDISAGTTISVPIGSLRNGGFTALGDISLNASIGFNHLSDFGTLGDWSAGVTWKPAESLSLQATYIESEVAPGLNQLGSPTITTLNVPIFDLVQNESVLATTITGGNPDLRSEKQADWRFSANWQLPFWDGTRLTGEYVRNRSSDVTSSFPFLTPIVESAFADRVTRDPLGQLLAIDRRPITFAQTRSDRIVLGLVTRGSFGGGSSSEGRSRGGRPDGNARQRAGRSGGPPTGGSREQFAALREQLCGADGDAFAERLANAIEQGENLEENFPSLASPRMARLVDRLKRPDGTVDRELLAQLRERMCSADGRPQEQGTSGAPRGRPRGGAAAMGFGGATRYFVNLTHNIELTNDVLLADNGPVFDQLAGDSLSSSGVSRHTSRLEAGLFRSGVGMRLSARYTGNARINGSGLPGSTDLFFGDLATFDWRVFTNLGQVLGSDKKWMENLRVAFRIDNVFDGRRRVTDNTGNVPLGYQPELLDPTGRYIGIDLRKLF